MTQEAGQTAAARDRDLRLQSAKKKLKSYRAKQAQMEKAKRQSAAIMASSSIGSSSSLTVAQLSSPSVSPTRLLGGVINDAFNESQAAMMGGDSKRNSARLSASIDSKRHSRGMSRSGAGHGRGHSRTGSISLSQAALSNGVVAAALGHLAQKGSISLSAPRPVSTHVANTSHSHTRGHSRSGSRSLAASGPRSRPSSMVGAPLHLSSKADVKANDSWRDEDAASVEDLFKTPTMNSGLGDISRFETPTYAAPPAVSLTMATPTASTPAPAHARRLSRHSRKGSVSTRRESMEIMGGLANNEPNCTSNRHSRRISSTHRWSGLQTASVLFGGEPDYIPYERKREPTDGDKSDDEGGDRQTALEKLEGRRQRTTSLQSSVQLPSFDDVHGEEGMDKRASLNLLEANAQTTSSEKPPAAIVPASPRPMTLMETGTDLGILVEEEEEDEESGILSPIKERSALDFTSEEEKRRRKLAEQEVIKRNRRGSLTPRPLKLKSRPASLFVSPRPTGLPMSQSLPMLADLAEEKTSTDSSVSVPATTSIKDEPLAAQRETAALAREVTSASRPTQTSAMVTPSKETKRSWRASMPIASMSMSPAATQSPVLSVGSPSPVVSSGGARQGMRALRLGGAGNLSISSSASSTGQRQHKNHTDSTSSMTSTTSGSSVPLSKRGSILYSSTPPSVNASTFRDDGSMMAKKRGSLIYKTSPLDAATVSQLSTSSASTPSPSGASSMSTGGVPLSMFEELKARHQREVGLLDEARHKIARLESESVAELERRKHQMAELEQWSAEEKKALGLRIEHLEASIAQVVEVRQAKENSLVEEKSHVEEQLASLTTQFEDVEAERDMLRDDVDGWRTRCGDLEKSLRIERQTTDELRMAKGAGKDRIRELLQKLHENNIDVDRSSVDEEELSAELKAVLRSPNMGPASPMLGGSAQRGGATSPILGDHFQMPPSQAVQLLKEMRQQIFNLAGSLDHERKQHMLARQDAEEARAEISRLSGMAGDESKQSAGTDVSYSPDRSSMVSSTPAPSTSTPPQTRTKRNHVFAYDSSMESRTGTNSTGSGSAMTYQTSHHEDDEDAKAKEDETHALPELVGLGVGSLGPLREEEEATEGSHRTASPAVRESLDIESGLRYSDGDSLAPPTPSLEHTRDYADSRSMSALHLGSGQDGTSAHAGVNSSSVSSAESHGPPSPVSHVVTTGTSASSQDTVLPPAEAETVEEEEEDPSPMLESRPEFIREWSFEKATAKINRPRGTGTRPKRPTVITNNMLSTRKKNRKISIDDFFGIMSLDENESLPALPTPSEALEMPPLFIETDYRSSMNRPMGYGTQPRYPSQIRPPVPQTSAMYSRSSNSDRSSTSSRGSSTYNNRPSGQTPRGESSFQSSIGMDSAASLAPAGGMLSRVASFTSAFGGYLLGSSAPPTNEQGYVNGNDNIGWSVTRREEEMA